MNFSGTLATARASRRTVLSNGLTVLLAPDPEGDAFSLCLAVPAGARTDPAGQSGVAHLLEHGYALGSRMLAAREIELLVERAGGARGALTTQDVTLHFCTLPRAELASVLRWEADRFFRLALPEAEVIQEREVVLHEGTQRLIRSVGGALVHRLLATAYDHHPYRNPVVGWADDVRRLRRQDLMACYDLHYRPANACLALIGRFDPGQALDLIEARFGSADARPSTKIELPPETAQTSPRAETMAHAGAALPCAAILWRAPPLDHADTAAFLVAVQAFNETTPELQMQPWLLRDAGPATLHIAANNQAAVEAKITAAFDATEVLAAGKAAEPALAAARRGAGEALSSRLSDPLRAATTLARFQSSSEAGIDRLFGLQAQVVEVSTEAVARVTARYLSVERSTTVRLSPVC